MMPGLVPGSLVRLVSPTRRPPRLGDVVLVRLPAGLRLHRLVWGPPVAPGGTRWRTKGDRSPVWDPALDPRLVLGTVVSEEGRGRGLGRALRSLCRGLWARVRMSKREFSRR
jgi:hypothetical protein